MNVFINENKDNILLPLMIVLTMVEIVPENIYIDVSRALQNHLNLYSSKEADDTSDTINQDFYHPINYFLEILSAKKVAATMYTIAGKISINCIKFSDENIASTIRTKIWNDYIYFREPILDWLFDILTTNIKGKLEYQIIKALAEVSKLNISFAMENIIQRIAKLNHGESIKYLSNILEYLIKDSDYAWNIEELLMNWLRNRKTILWRVSYQLYNEKFCEEYVNLLQNKLEEIIDEDLNEYFNLMKSRDIEIPFSSKGFLIYPARNNKAAQTFLIQNLNRLYNCKEIRRKDFISYFLVLFRNDFYLEFSKNYHLLFAEEDNQSDLREILVYVWQHKSYRTYLNIILKAYLEEIEKNKFSWEYMKRFFLTIAFTGSKSDFENIIYFLENNNGEYFISIKQWLLAFKDTRKERRKGQIKMVKKHIILL